MSVVVTLENATLEVEPGSSRDATARIRNTGQIVDRFTIEILGSASAWVTISPAVVPLFPGAEEAVRVTFSPPRGSSPRAGRIVFGLRVRSSENPSDSAVEEGSVTVLPATAATAEIVPQTSRGSRGGRHEVTVTNGGNVPIEVAVDPSDANRILSFDVRPPRLNLEPGTTGSALISVRPNETFFLGPPQSKPFEVSIVSSGQAPFEVRGSILQRAILPSWLPKAAAAVLVFAVAGGVMAATVLQPRPAASPTPAPGASAVAQVSNPPQSVAPGPQSAPPTVPPSEVPSLIPTPLPSFALDAVTTDVVTTNFDFVCNDEACQADAISGMRFLAANLQDTYFGGGLSGTTNFDSSQVPVVLQADSPFAWKQGAATGTTDRFVVDLAPVVFGTGPAYAVLFDDTDLLHRNYLPNDFALQLFDRLYDSKAMVVPSYDPIDWRLIPIELFPVGPILILPTATP